MLFLMFLVVDLQGFDGAPPGGDDEPRRGEASRDNAVVPLVVVEASAQDAHALVVVPVPPPLVLPIAAFTRCSFRGERGEGVGPRDGRRGGEGREREDGRQVQRRALRKEYLVPAQGLDRP